MRTAILLYENMTALDAIGPYEILSRLPGAELTFVAREAGAVRTDTGFLTLVAEAGIHDVSSTDILLIPGGPGDEAVRADAATLDWIAGIHETTRWTTSVCTGALILAAAGVLKGLPATTHWASLDDLRDLGAEPVQARFVESGKIITAAGVSAGIDMALHLTAVACGEDYAKALQLGIEYDPQPPFDSGSPSKAPAALIELVRATLGGAPG
jgi:transcriptional regulator GlxA family with amidase domain